MYNIETYCNVYLFSGCMTVFLLFSYFLKYWFVLCVCAYYFLNFELCDFFKLGLVFLLKAYLLTLQSKFHHNLSFTVSCQLHVCFSYQLLRDFYAQRAIMWISWFNEHVSVTESCNLIALLSCTSNQTFKESTVICETHTGVAQQVADECLVSVLRVFGHHVKNQQPIHQNQNHLSLVKG